MTDCACLAGDAAAVYGYQYVERIRGIRNLERSLNDHAQRFKR